MARAPDLPVIAIVGRPNVGKSTLFNRLVGRRRALVRVVPRTGRPVVLAANKVDGPAQEPGLADLYRLGVGDPVPVSSEHGRGVGELLEVLRARIPEVPTTPPRPGAPVDVAVVGRPNVGKSSLVNAMVGAERVLVHEAPGTTRDAVDTTLVYEGRTYVLVDTAGIRRKGRVFEPLEKLAVVMALRSLERCHVALVVLDAAEGVTAQDAHIAGYADQAGRAAVLVVNKWDLVPKGLVTKADVVEQLRDRLPFLEHAPVCFTSAVRGEGVSDLFDTIDEVAAAFGRRVGTTEVTTTLRSAIERRPVSRVRAGRARGRAGGLPGGGAHSGASRAAARRRGPHRRPRRRPGLASAAGRRGAARLDAQGVCRSRLDRARARRIGPGALAAELAGIVRPLS